MSGGSIPTEAIDAAAKIVADREGYGWVNDEYREVARSILEAAAPYMLAAAWDDGYDRAESDHYGTGFWTKRLRGNPYTKLTAP